jgi:bifunctional DNA-binding transcriptional regulator/antitoxin component of YhaV-PrlF toxin-antitoxin module
MTALMSGPRGEIVLPENLRSRHGISGGTPIRIVETRTGILLVPLTKEPMSAALAQELEEWQAVAESSWQGFEYQDDGP